MFQCQSCSFVTINKQKFEIHQTKHLPIPIVSPPPNVSSLPSIIQINETPPPQQDDNHISNPVSTASSSSDDIIILAAPPPSSASIHASNTAPHLDFPLIRPAVFANNFSNIENMRFLPYYQPPPTNTAPLETVDASVIANHSCDNISFNIDLT